MPQAARSIKRKSPPSGGLLEERAKVSVGAAADHDGDDQRRSGEEGAQVEAARAADGAAEGAAVEARAVDRTGNAALRRREFVVAGDAVAVVLDVVVDLHHRALARSRVGSELHF